MSHFVIFFEEKEGTSPLVRLLDHFDQVSIVHQIQDRGWEPFDHHNCGHMPLGNLRRCLEMIFNKDPLDLSELNRIYTQTAVRPLDEFDKSASVGFKMRFHPPRKSPIYFPGANNVNWWMERIFRRTHQASFREMFFDLLKKHDVTVLLAVRQDVFRLGLSKYHGDGTGRPGHIQFKLASGQIKLEDIGKITVDCDRLEGIIQDCERSHVEKRQFLSDLRSAGIKAHPILYEDFVADKHSYFHYLFKCLGLEVTDGEIDRALEAGAHFQKVHSDDISEFTENPQEVLGRFQDRFVAWNKE